MSTTVLSNRSARRAKVPMRTMAINEVLTRKTPIKLSEVFTMMLGKSRA
jgi:hypothetical protein